jgi:hypothetical protein
LRPNGDASVSVNLRRFAESFPVELGTAPTGSWSEIVIPADRSRRPWQAQLIGSGAVDVCGGGQRAG